MKTKSLKSKVLLLLLISISCSFIILGYYNTVSAYKSEHNLIKQKELDLAHQTSKFINSYIESKIDIVVAVAEEMPTTDLNVNNKNIIEKLRLGAKSGNFADLYVGFEENGDFLLSDGTFLNIEKDNFDGRTRPWYKQAVETNKPGVTKPYVDITTKKLVVTIFTPLIQNNKLIGVVGSDIFLDTVVNTILNVQIGKGGFAYLIDETGSTIIHKDENLLNKKNQLFAQVKTDKNENFGIANADGIERFIAYSKIPLANWYLTIELDGKSIFEDINNNIIKEISLYVVLLVVILLLLYFTLVKLLAPLKQLENGFYSFFDYLKGETKDINKLNITSNDEFGTMGSIIDSQMEIIANNLNKDRDLIEDVKKVVNRVKEGKFDYQVNKTTSNESLNELKDIINDMIKTISNNVDVDINIILQSLEKYSQLNFLNNIENASGDVSKGLNNLCNIINGMLRENKNNGLVLDENARILLANVDTLNRASNETAASLEETAAALEEITSTTVNTTDNIVQMATFSNELSESIKEGQVLATSTVESMDEINSQTQAIADAITVIDQIAFQTNILSLNAAVEAATAGEAGKGFAVVAQEVRNLASRSADAAKEIKNLVENATVKTNTGKQSADKMIKGYEKLNENILKTTNIITEISGAAKEQQAGIEQINDVVTKLDQQTQNNASVATQTHDVAVQTSEIAQTILDTVNQKQFREN